MRRDSDPVVIGVPGVQTWKVVRGREVDGWRAARERHIEGTSLSRMWHDKTMVNDGTVISREVRQLQ